MPTPATGATTTRPRWEGRLLLAPGVVLYVGPGSAADLHAHNAVQFVWSAQGEVSLHLADRNVRGGAFLIPAGIEHAFDASAQSIALLLLERHGVRGASLDRRASALLGVDLAPAVVGLPFPTVDLAPDGAVAWCDALLGALGARVTSTPPISHASRRAIDHVEQHLDGTPRLSDAARSSGLSTTRLTHVFSREVGIPFRRYVL